MRTITLEGDEVPDHVGSVSGLKYSCDGLFRYFWHGLLVIGVSVSVNGLSAIFCAMWVYIYLKVYTHRGTGTYRD